jgi:hypothetical protein
VVQNQIGWILISVRDSCGSLIGVDPSVVQSVLCHSHAFLVPLVSGRMADMRVAGVHTSNRWLIEYSYWLEIRVASPNWVDPSVVHTGWCSSHAGQKFVWLHPTGWMFILDGVVVMRIRDSCGFTQLGVSFRGPHWMVS